MKMRKLLALMLVCAMIIAAFAGCSKSGDESADTGSSSEATNEENEASDSESTAAEDSESPAEDAGVTLTIGLVPRPLTTDYDDNWLTNYIEEETGVNLEFFFFPSDGEEAKQKFSMMTAGGETLPDIVCLGLSEQERYSYGSSGYFISLNDYMENSAPNWNHMMDTWATPQQKANVLNDSYSFDGNIYVFPRYIIDPADAVSLYMSINKTWLDAVNLDVPTTTDELYTAMKAFKEEDANGNGDANDEIPMMGHKEGGGSVTTFLLNSFTYFAYDAMFGYQLTVENGQLSAPFITDEFREGMRYINQLVEEGLISDLSFTQEAKELRSIMQAPDDQASLVGVLVDHPSPAFGTGAARVKEYVGIPALEGPEGVKCAPFAYQGGTYNVFITSDCENPDAAFKFLDDMQQEDLSMSMRFGEKDYDWRYEEGETYYAGLGEDYKGIYNQNINDERVPWTEEDNVIWHDNTLNSIPPMLFGGTLAIPFPDEYQQYKLEDLCYNVFPLRYDLHPEEMPIRISFNEEETDQIYDIQTSIHTYVDESITRFALGELDIEGDWDSYLSELDAMGLEQYMEVSQTAYDRAHK